MLQHLKYTKQANPQRQKVIPMVARSSGDRGIGWEVIAYGRGVSLESGCEQSINH